MIGFIEDIYQENWQPVKRTISRTEDGEMYKIFNDAIKNLLNFEKEHGIKIK